MTDLIKKELEEYRKASINYWYITKQYEIAEDAGTASDERLLLEAIRTARKEIEYDTREYEKYYRRQENEQD